MERSRYSAALAALRTQFGPRCSEAPAVRLQHARGESPFPPALPDAVIQVRDTEEVAAVLTICHAHQVPVIAHGAGSSLEGQLLAVRGGVSLDLSEMNRILEIQPDDFTATVQAGVTREQLNLALKTTGFFFSVDPGAHATLGGMAATRASGTNTVRYGSMRENVLAMEVVLADGRVIRTGSKALKSAAGYDLTRLFVGSEGTLGIITELTVKLQPQPEFASAAVMCFDSPPAAVSTVVQAIQAGLPLARSEYLCAASIRAINAASPDLSLQERPTLFLEFHGSPSSVVEQTEMLQDIAGHHGAEGFQWAHLPEDRNRLWLARHRAYYACRQSRPGSEVITTDTCVPRSRLAQCLDASQALAETASFPAMTFGHVGDGNFHVLMVIDPDSQVERQEAEHLNERIVALALAAGGTCTGEHGVGYHKKEFLKAETGERAVAVMQQIKAVLDPHGILNPDKIF